jgi:hypothetical protein
LKRFSLRGLQRKLDIFVAMAATSGFFDCVRLAPHSAQDDKEKEIKSYYQGEARAKTKAISRATARGTTRATATSTAAGGGARAT